MPTLPLEGAPSSRYNLHEPISHSDEKCPTGLYGRTTLQLPPTPETGSNASYRMTVWNTLRNPLRLWPVWIGIDHRQTETFRLNQSDLWLCSATQYQDRLIWTYNAPTGALPRPPCSARYTALSRSRARRRH